MCCFSNILVILSHSIYLYDGLLSLILLWSNVFKLFTLGHHVLGKTQVLFRLIKQGVHSSKCRKMRLFLIYQQNNLRKMNQRMMKGATREGGVKKRNLKERGEMTNMKGMRSGTLATQMIGEDTKRTSIRGDMTPSEHHKV